MEKKAEIMIPRGKGDHANMPFMGMKANLPIKYLGLRIYGDTNTVENKLVSILKLNKFR